MDEVRHFVADTVVKTIPYARVQLRQRHSAFEGIFHGDFQTANLFAISPDAQLAAVIDVGTDRHWRDAE